MAAPNARSRCANKGSRAVSPSLAASPAEPELHLAVDGEARYERVDEILAAIARAGVTRMGFVGNERFAASLG